MSISQSLPRAQFRGLSFVTLVCGTLIAADALAQHAGVPFQGGIPVAPLGLSNKSLGSGPFEYATGEGQDIRVVVVTKELSFPFAIAFLPDGTMLMTERKADIRVIRNGKLDPKPVAGGPVGYFAGTSGLPGAIHGYMDLVLHPQFAQNQLLYLSYTKRMNDRNYAAVARMHWTGSALDQVKDVWMSDETTQGAAPIVFGRDRKLYIATSGGDAQDPSSTAGKVLRINDDGSVPKDNPFIGQKAVPAGAKPGAAPVAFNPAVFSLGHRSSLGLAVHPVTGEVWQSENGPNGGDELNIIRAGKNYGWPLVSYGRTYPGPWQTQAKLMPTHEGYEAPVVYWTPAIAVSGFAFYTGDKLAKWKGDVFVGGLRQGEIPGTGHLDRILFNEKMEELRRESLLVDLRQRIRDVKQGPDGLLYVITDEAEGAVLRIEPK
jgi:glucose/arabinose dehydrogenase